MTSRPITNLSASVRQRLLNLSRRNQEDYNLILSRYANERLLYRLAQSSFAHQFVLKGAMLFVLWTGKLHRPTHDVDLLGYGNPAQEELAQLFRDVCVIVVEPDGIIFDPDSVRVEDIREGQEYGGQRVQVMAMLGTARISVQIDVGFGDAVTPTANEIEYPTLLDFPAPILRVYPRETVVAEKLHAMVTLGMLNSRMKDFYDLWILAGRFPFDGETLVAAIRATFARRGTELNLDTPIALTGTFADDPNKRRQWQAFLNRNKLDVVDMDFSDIIVQINAFLAPPFLAAGEGVDFAEFWPPGGSWTT